MTLPRPADTASRPAREPPGETTFGAGALAVARRNLRVWMRYAISSMVGNFGEPILQLLALGWGLGQLVPPIDGMSYAEFMAPGLVISTAMYTASFEGTFGSYTRLETQKTFDALLATPVTVAEIVAGEVLWGGIKAAISGSSVLLVVAAFGLVPSWLALAVIPLAGLAGLAFMALAMVVTAVAKSYDFFNYFFTIVLAPLFLFSGIFFPIKQLPAWARSASQFLPLTHMVELARGMVRGHLPEGWGWNLGAIGLFTVLAYCAAAWLMERRMRI